MKHLSGMFNLLVNAINLSIHKKVVDDSVIHASSMHIKFHTLTMIITSCGIIDCYKSCFSRLFCDAFRFQTRKGTYRYIFTAIFFIFRKIITDMLA